jgi:hypothetical protein
VDLIDDINSGLEALKRALFIQWYAMSEPSCYTGIFDTDPDAQVKVFNRLDEMTKHAKLDFELCYMLSWYYKVTDWYFDRQKNIPYLKKFLNETPYETPCFRMSDFDNRGQMARYWQSLSTGITEPNTTADGDE